MFPTSKIVWGVVCNKTLIRQDIKDISDVPGRVGDTSDACHVDEVVIYFGASYILAINSNTQQWCNHWSFLVCFIVDKLNISLQNPVRMQSPAERWVSCTEQEGNKLVFGLILWTFF